MKKQKTIKAWAIVPLKRKISFIEWCWSLDGDDDNDYYPMAIFEFKKDIKAYLLYEEGRTPEYIKNFQVVPVEIKILDK